jgi:hypothetical protein
MRTQLKKRFGTKKGIVVFIAVVTVGALLLVAAAISNIAYKEQLISSSGRESRYAFFAADSGVECALFHDLKGGNDPEDPFLFSIPDGNGGVIPEEGDLVCDGNDPFGPADWEPQIIDSFVDSSNAPSGYIVTEFYFEPPTPTPTCAIVTVTKTDSAVSVGRIDTRIESSGYNNNCSAIIHNGATSIRNLERTFEVNY